MLKVRSLRFAFALAVLVYGGCSSPKPVGERVAGTEKATLGEGVKITSLEPGRGGRGSTVIINGAGFSDDPAQLVVQFGATRAAVKNAGSKLVVAEVPPSLMDGKYNVTVTNTKTNQTSGGAEFMLRGDAAERPRADLNAPLAGPSAGSALTPSTAKPPVAGVAPYGSAPPAEMAAPAEPRSASYTIPAGTPLVVRSLDSISSARNNVGDRFQLTLDEPLVVNGHTVARKGSTVTGRITQAKRSGRVKGRAQLGFTLVSLQPAGHHQSYEIRTRSYAKEAPGTKKRDAMVIGGGAGIGTAIGAIAGGKKGAAIGAAVGGGAGTGTVLSTRGKEVEFPSETRFTLKLRAPVQIH